MFLWQSLWLLGGGVARGRKGSKGTSEEDETAPGKSQAVPPGEQHLPKNSNSCQHDWHMVTYG